MVSYVENVNESIQDTDSDEEEYVITSKYDLMLRARLVKDIEREGDVGEPGPLLLDEPVMREKVLNEYPVFKDMLLMYPDLDTLALVRLKEEYFEGPHISEYGTYIHEHGPDESLRHEHHVMFTYFYDTFEHPEIWKPVVQDDIKDIYLISSKGRVMNKETGQFLKTYMMDNNSSEMIGDNSSVKLEKQ